MPQEVPLPHAPDLAHLTIITGRSPSAEEYAAVPVGPTPDSTRRIRPAALRHLARTPSLSTIQLIFAEAVFPSITDSKSILPDFIAPPGSWIRDGPRGTIIREYTQTGQPAFWHMRTLSRMVQQSYSFSYVGIRRHWEDWTQYDGITVPRDVLSAVYAAIGESSDFLEGGRGLPLGDGDKAWAILRHWRGEAESEAYDGDVVSEVSADEGSVPESADESDEEPEEEDEQDEDDDDDPYGYEDYDGYDDYDSDDPMGDGNTEYAQEMYDHYGLGIASGRTMISCELVTYACCMPTTAGGGTQRRAYQTVQRNTNYTSR